MVYPIVPGESTTHTHTHIHIMQGGRKEEAVRSQGAGDAGTGDRRQVVPCTTGPAGPFVPEARASALDNSSRNVCMVYVCTAVLRRQEDMRKCAAAEHHLSSNPSQTPPPHPRRSFATAARRTPHPPPTPCAQLKTQPERHYIVCCPCCCTPPPFLQTGRESH